MQQDPHQQFTPRFNHQAPYNQPPWQQAGNPQGNVPPQGYPPQGNMPPQNYPPQGNMPPQNYPPQGNMPPQNYPPQGNMPPQNYPPQGNMPPQNYPPQGNMPPQNYPPQGNVPPQNYPPQGSVPPSYAPPPRFAPPAPPTGPRATPPTGMPPQKNHSHKWLIAVLVIIILSAAGVLALHFSRPGGRAYAYVSAGTLSASYKGDALIVRNETLYTQEGASMIDEGVEEGASVKRGESVCVVYSAGFNTRELTKLENYRNQIKEYQKTLLTSSTAKDMKLERLETEVLARALEAQSLVQKRGFGSLVEQEKRLKEAMQDRRIYLKRKYPDDQKLSRLYDDENSQLQKISSWTKQYAAPADGLVSFYTDGFENVLNLHNYNNYTPAGVRSMINGNIPRDESRTKNTVPVYRLVRPGQWVVLMLCDDPDWTPVEGRTYKLRIENFNNTIVNATVESFTRSGGEMLVRLAVSGDINIENIMYTRTCSVQLGESVDSLTVPARAIFNQDNRPGVVMATEGGEYFTPVNVISVDGDTAHIVPVHSGVLYEGLPVLLF